MKIAFAKQLESIGFGPKQSIIYVALLDMGQATAAEIGKKTGINRTTVYDVVDELQQTGLVTRVPEIKKKTYRAESPEKIPIILEKQAQHLRDMARQSQGLVSMLQSVVAKTPSKPKIKIFEGEKGLKSLYDASLLCKTFIRSFLTADELEAFDSEYAQSYFERRARKGIKIRGILNDSEASRGYKKLSKSSCARSTWFRARRWISSQKFIFTTTLSRFFLSKNAWVFRLNQKTSPMLLRNFTI